MNSGSISSGTERSSDFGQFLALAGCFLLSGFAALLYETVWLRQFSVHFGTSEQSLAIVLGTYMGGLAIGSLIASKYASRMQRPLLAYGLLELGIAVTALLVPVSLKIVRAVQVAFFGNAEIPPDAGDFSQVTFAFVGAFVATILPTTMMGATLPMLAKHVVHRDDHLGNRIGGLYAINTLGAVLGTLTAAFYCLPALGLLKTMFVGALLNLIVFIIIWISLRRKTDAAESTTATSTAEPSSTGASAIQRDSDNAQTRQWILLLIAASGAVSFAYEVLFTRMLGHILGGSVFAFATMLSSFLLGIAIGGAIASRFAKNSMMSATGFFYAQCGTALLALMSWHWLEKLATQINELSKVAETESLPRVVCAMLVLLPPAITIGMTFPWAIRVHARDEHDAASSSAKVYACSTLGGVLGAFLTGTYLLPNTNYEFTLLLAILANIAIAASVYFLASFKPIQLTCVAVVLLVGFLFRPTQPDQLLRVSSFENFSQSGELFFVATGRSATVTAHHDAGQFVFSTNGLSEAGTRPRGSLFAPRQTTTWLGVLPSLLRPNIRSLLVVGFGGGNAPAHAPKSVRKIDVFELERGVIEANRLVSQRRERNPMADTRINIIMNDGRGGLALSSKKYDAIVSQPSHPWTAGASHLYTREFAGLAKDHLTDDGIFVLWMDRDFIDAEILKSLSATLADVYPNVSLFMPNDTAMLFVGAINPIELPAEIPEPESRTDKKMFQQMGLTGKHMLHAARVLDDKAMRKMGKNASLTTDNNNLLALRRLDRSKHEKIIKDISTLLQQHDRVLDDDTPDVDSEQRMNVAINRSRFKRLESAKLVGQSIANESRRLFAQGMLAMQENQFKEAYDLFRQSTELDDSFEQAWAMRFHANSQLPEKVEADVEEAEQLAKKKLSQPYLSIASWQVAIKDGDTEKLKEIDSQLESIGTTDPLFSVANMYRILWRDIDKASGTPRQRGVENLELIDKAIPYDPAAGLFLLRLKAAMLAQRPSILVTMAQAVAKKVEGKINQTSNETGGKFIANSSTEPPPELSPEELVQMRTALLNCLRSMAPIEGDRRVAPDRYHGVKLVVSSVLQLVETKLGDQMPSGAGN